MTDLVSLLLRVIIGVVFAAHGAQKAFGWFGGPGMEGFSQMLTGLGFKPALFWAYLAAYVEFLGGLALILGVFTRLFSALLVLVMAVAILKVHLAKGLFLAKGGFEYSLVLLCVLVALVLLGTGKYGITKKF